MLSNKPLCPTPRRVAGPAAMAGSKYFAPHATRNTSVAVVRLKNVDQYYLIVSLATRCVCVCVCGRAGDAVAIPQLPQPAGNCPASKAACRAARIGSVPIAGAGRRAEQQ